MTNDDLDAGDTALLQQYLTALQERGAELQGIDGPGSDDQPLYRISGLGYLLNDGYQFFRNDVVIAAMLSIGVLGYLSDLIVVLVRDHLLAWNRLETVKKHP